MTIWKRPPFELACERLTVSESVLFTWLRIACTPSPPVENLLLHMHSSCQRHPHVTDRDSCHAYTCYFAGKLAASGNGLRLSLPIHVSFQPVADEFSPLSRERHISYKKVDERTPNVVRLTHGSVRQDYSGGSPYPDFLYNEGRINDLLLYNCTVHMITGTATAVKREPAMSCTLAMAAPVSALSVKTYYCMQRSSGSTSQEYVSSRAFNFSIFVVFFI